MTTGPLSASDVTLSGFSMVSKLGALASLGGARGESDTLIQSMSSKLRLAPEGYRFDALNIVVPSLGTVTGAGTISPSNSLNFRMLAKLNAGGGALGGLKGVAGLGQSGNGLPFRIQGTTSNPVFVPEFTGAFGGQMAAPSQGIGEFLGGLTGKKKK